jgi:hypothetical protein
MKLLSKNEVKSISQKETDIILEKNSRLAEYLSKGLKKFNLIKDNYDQDKIRKQKEFDAFCEKINTKKSELLKDYKKWEKLVEGKKELYYALIEKNDELIEREENIKRGEERIKVREDFNLENEARLKAKLDTLIK